MLRYVSPFILLSLMFFLTTCSSPETKEESKEPTQQENQEAPQKGNEDMKTPTSTRSGEADTSNKSGEAEQPTGKVETSSEEAPLFAIPGQCFHKVFYPATYKEVEEKIMVKPAEVKIQKIPAKYEEVPKQVLVRPETTVLEPVPPVFEVVDEKVITRPAYIRKEEIPPTYETVTEKIIDKEGYTKWERDPQTGLLCLVEVPPTFKEIQRQIMRTPSLIREVEVPAEYTIVRKQVEKAPASTREVKLPPAYKTIYEKREVEPEKEIKTEIPPEYKTITRTVIDQEARTEWIEVLCDTNTTPAKIRELEEALKKNGYDPGPIDGKADGAFYDALRKFQADRKLTVNQDRFIYMETVKALGVNPR